jgi:hypothetical protein
LIEGSSSIIASALSQVAHQVTVIGQRDRGSLLGTVDRDKLGFGWLR